MLADIASYAPVVVLVALAVFLTAFIVVLTHLVGPRRRGPIKHSPYESGMPIVGDARRRFNVRFYTIAMVFLLFDVEVVFLWPWAPIFRKVAAGQLELHDAAGLMIGKGFLLVEMSIFMGILLIGYVYAWRRGVFRWD